MSTIHRLPIAWFVLVAACGWSPGAEAQSLAGGTPPIHLPAGAKVWVTTVDGREHEGRILALTPSHMVVRVGKTEVPVTWATVRQVARPDPKWNGALFGAIGGAVTLGALGKASCGDCAPNSPTGASQASVVTPMALIGAGAGAAVGAWVDSLFEGRRVVYNASGGPSLRVCMVAMPGKAGIVATIGW